MPLSPDSVREIRLAATLSGVLSLRMLGLFLILPVFMVLAADLPGFTPVLGGLALGVYGLTQALLQQPFGRLSDRIGRRPVLLAGLALFAAGGAVAALADSIALIILGRALQGCGAIAGVVMALAAEETRPPRRPLVLAALGMGIGGAFLVSLVISVPLASRLGLSGLFWLTVGFALGAMALVQAAPRRRGPLGDDAPVAVNRVPGGGRIGFLAASVFLLHGVMTALFVVVPLQLVATGELPLADHWRVYLPAMAASLLVALPVLAWAGRRGREGTTLPWAFAVLAFALFGLAAGNGGAWPVIGLAVYFSAFTVLEAAMPALVARVSGGAGRGRRMGFYSTFQFLGAFAGGVGGGLLLTGLGGPATLGSAGGVCLLWAGLSGRVSSRLFPTGCPG